MGDTEKEPINTDHLDGTNNQVIPEITVTQIPEPVPKKTKVDAHLLWTLVSNNDIQKLRLFGLKYGFITNQLRQKIYPILLKFDMIPELKPTQKLSDLALHQLECDCNRSFSNFEFSVEKLTLLRSQLLETLVYLLTRCPYLHYYQGFHSIASIFILMLGHEEAKKAILVISNFWLRDYMESTIHQTVKHLTMVEFVVQKADAKLYAHLKQLPDYDPIFLISWVLTWLSMQTSMETTFRIFDAIISTEPDFIIYLSSVIILEFRKEFLECSEMTDIYTLVKKHDWNSMDYDNIVFKSMEMRKKYKQSLRYTRILGRKSALNTFALFKRTKVEFDFERIESMVHGGWFDGRSAVVVVVLAVGLGIYLKYGPNLLDYLLLPKSN